MIRGSSSYRARASSARPAKTSEPERFLRRIMSWASRSSSCTSIRTGGPAISRRTGPGNAKTERTTAARTRILNGAAIRFSPYSRRIALHGREVVGQRRGSQACLQAWVDPEGGACMDPSDSGFANRFSELVRGRPGHLPAHLVGVRPVGEPGQVRGIGDGAALDEVAHGGYQPLPPDGGRERDAGLLLAQPPEVIRRQRNGARDRSHIDAVGHAARDDFDRLP